MELQAFKDDCSPQKNVVFKRLQYWSHQRTAGTSVDTFITELRHKSKECEFGLSENDMLRDKLVFSITDCHLKDRLLQERGLTLHRAIEICRTTEQEKTPLQAMETEHGIQQVPVDGEMKMIIPDKNLHHNTRKHLGYQSVPNMDESVKLVVAAFMPKVQMHRLQLQLPSVTDCVFSERKNVEPLIPECLHTKEEPETLIGIREGNQLFRHQETNTAASPVKCEDEEEEPQTSQLHWRQQTQINIKEETSSCTLDEFMKRQSVGINSKEPEAARNPDLSSLFVQGPDGMETDSSLTEDRNTYEEDDDDDDDDDDSWQNPLSDSETNDLASTRIKRKMSDSSKNDKIEHKAAKTQIISNTNVQKETGQARAKSFSCDVCHKCFKLKFTLNQHVRVHTGEKPFNCDICSKCFSQKASLKNHIKVHTGVKPYSCGVCSKCFKKKFNLKQHLKVHTGDKPFNCDVCSKCFVDLAHLKQHRRSHTEEKPFSCDICSKCFRQKASLDAHMRVHTGDKPYSCDVCGKCFNVKFSLNQHLRVHTGEKPFICDICSKCFGQLAHLNQHKIIHTGEKPYSCDVCSKCFSQQGSLNYHRRIHMEEKPFSCAFCSKGFVKKYEMMIHERIHTGEKPCRCDVCNKCFRNTSDLSKHKQIHKK